VGSARRSADQILEVAGVCGVKLERLFTHSGVGGRKLRCVGVDRYIRAFAQKQPLGRREQPEGTEETSSLTITPTDGNGGTIVFDGNGNCTITCENLTFNASGNHRISVGGTRSRSIGKTDAAMADTTIEWTDATWHPVPFISAIARYASRSVAVSRRSCHLPSAWRLPVDIRWCFRTLLAGPPPWTRSFFSVLAPIDSLTAEAVVGERRQAPRHRARCRARNHSERLTPSTQAS
jgi:hypothetical protein